MNLLGSYVPLSSPLHTLDNTVRILDFILLFAAFTIASGHIARYILSAIVLAFLFRVGGIRLVPVIRSFWRFRQFLLTVFLMNAFFQPSERPYFSWWIITFSLDGIMFGIRMIMSVLLLTALASLLTQTATPIEITDGLRGLLHPLSYLRLPVDEASSIISIAISFIPVLSAESEAIMLSARARGAVPGGKKIKDRALSIIPLALPLFIAAFRRADETATAMEARGYGGKRGRSKSIKIRIGRREILSFLFSLIILLGAIALKGV